MVEFMVALRRFFEDQADSPDGDQWLAMVAETMKLFAVHWLGVIDGQVFNNVAIGGEMGV